MPEHHPVVTHEQSFLSLDAFVSHKKSGLECQLWLGGILREYCKRISEVFADLKHSFCSLSSLMLGVKFERNVVHLFLKLKCGPLPSRCLKGTDLRMS